MFNKPTSALFSLVLVKDQTLFPAARHFQKVTKIHQILVRYLKSSLGPVSRASHFLLDGVSPDCSDDPFEYSAVIRPSVFQSEI